MRKTFDEVREDMEKINVLTDKIKALKIFDLVKPPSEKLEERASHSLCMY